MNLVGKILTVFIFVMSLVFMAFAVAVYATHKNWRDVVMRPREEAARGIEPGLMYQLEDAQNLYTDLETEKNNLETRLTAERDAAVQAHAKLNSKHVSLEQEYEKLTDDYNRINEETSKAVAAMNVAESRLADLLKEVGGLRNEIRLAQKDRADYFNRVVELTDKLNQTVDILKRLKARQLTLAQDLAKAKQVLQKFGLKAEPAFYADQPPDVDGIVLDVTRDNLVEIDIGEDDGLLKGHKLEVYRPTGYVGRIEVVWTDVDKSVCKIVPGYRISNILKDDRVASRIQ